MCDYSIKVESRPAVVGDRLETRNFGTGTVGLCDSYGLAVCLLPGTEIAFDAPVKLHPFHAGRVLHGLSNVAVFRQVNTHDPHRHHDSLAFPDGQELLLTWVDVCQHAVVLQLPATPRNDAERAEQRRAEYAE